MGDISLKGRSPILRQGFAAGGIARTARKAAKSFTEEVGGSEKGKPHSSKEGRIASGTRKIKRFLEERARKRQAGVLANPQAPSAKNDLKQWKKNKGPKVDYDRNPAPKYSSGPRDPWERKKYSPGPREFKTRTPKGYQAMKKGFEIELPDKKGYQAMKKGGKADKNWIQSVNKSIKKRGTKGKCTPITKKGCTGRAKALAKTFKKMAKKRKAA